MTPARSLRCWRREWRRWVERETASVTSVSTWKLAAHASMAAVYPCTSKGTSRCAASTINSSACSQRPTSPAACTSVPYTTALGCSPRCCMSAYSAITCTYRAPQTAVSRRQPPSAAPLKFVAARR